MCFSASLLWLCHAAPVHQPLAFLPLSSLWGRFEADTKKERNRDIKTREIAPLCLLFRPLSAAFKIISCHPKSARAATPVPTQRFKAVSARQPRRSACLSWLVPAQCAAFLSSAGCPAAPTRVQCVDIVHLTLRIPCLAYLFCFFLRIIFSISWFCVSPSLQITQLSGHLPASCSPVDPPGLCTTHDGHAPPASAFF